MKEERRKGREIKRDRKREGNKRWIRKEGEGKA